AGQLQLRRKPAIVSGWLFPRTIAASDARARLRFWDNRGSQAWEIEITRWVERVDVVATLGGNASDRPGFAQSVDFAALPSGTYRIAVVFQNSTGGQLCNGGRELLLK